MGHRVIKFDWLRVCLGGVCNPMHKVFGLVGLWPALCVAIDVGQQRAGGAVAQVCNVFTKRLKLVVGKPFGELVAADFKLGLPDAFAKLFG